MNILVIAATANEIHLFIDQQRLVPSRKDLDILVTGAGLTATTYALVKQVSIKKPALIIQAGIAGSFSDRYKPGKVVVVKKDCIADQGVTEKGAFKTMWDLNLVKKNQFPFRNGWLVNDNPLLKKLGLPLVKAISINEITTSAKKIEEYRRVFNPVIESMEGAALHYTALMESIPFLQLRSISNYIGVRDKNKWKMAEAITNLNNELIRLLDML